MEWGERLVKASESSREGVITPRRITLRLARIVLAQETVCSDKSGGRWEFGGNYHDAESRDTEVKVCGGGYGRMSDH